MVSTSEVFCLLLVAILWGGTNPFLKKGTEGIEGVQKDNKLLQFLAEVKFLFLNIKYLIPFLLNQSGSLVFYFTLASTEELEGSLKILTGFNKMLQLLFCILARSAASFISIPNDHLIAVRGHPAVLGCHFTPHPDLSSLTIEWQRQEDSQVVHSFYYEQNQLDHQSPEYHNRTSLYISELGKGNASLRIDGVGLKDMGWYLCKVNNINGAGKAKIKLDYGAFYSEPRLNIHVNSTTITVQFETEGFPKPEVIWLDEYGQSLIHHLELHDQTEDGLYLVKSRYEAQKPAVNVTFTLKNHLLNQNLERPVIYVPGDAGDGNIALIFLSILCIILVGIITHMIKSRFIRQMQKLQEAFLNQY